MDVINQSTDFSLISQNLKLILSPEALKINELLSRLLFEPSLEFIFAVIHQSLVYDFKVLNDIPVLFLRERLKHGRFILGTHFKGRKVDNQQT